MQQVVNLSAERARVNAGHQQIADAHIRDLNLEIAATPFKGEWTISRPGGCAGHPVVEKVLAAFNQSREYQAEYNEGKFCVRAK